MRRELILAVLWGLAILCGCAETTLGPDVVVPADIVLAPAAVVMDAADVAAVQAFDPAAGTLVLDAASDLAGRAAAGDVLIAGPATALPDGLLRQVTDVRVDGDRTILETVAAPLTRAVLSGACAGSLAITAAAADSVWTAAGVATAEAGAGEAFALDLELAPFDADGSAATAQDRLALSGRVELSGAVDLGLTVAASELTGFRWLATQSRVTDLSVAAGDDLAGGAWQQDLAVVVYPRTVLMLGELPLVLRPILRVSLDVEAAHAAGMTVAYDVDTTARSGAAFASGGWERLTEAVHRAGPLTHGIDAPSSLTVTVRSRLELRVFGDEALALTQAGVLRAAAAEQEEAGRTTLTGSMAYGLEASVDCAMARLGAGAPDHADGWTALESLLWTDGQSVGGLPATPSRPYPEDGAASVPATANLSWDGDSVADGVTYDLSLGTTLPPPLAVAGLAALEHQPQDLEPGVTYYWQVTARNAAGATSGPLWSFTVGGSVGAEPQPRFHVVALTPDSFSLGHSVELLISVANQGAAAAGSGIAVSFPDLDDVDDGARIDNSGSSTGDAPGLLVTPRGGTLADADCAPRSASHLLVEYADTNWYAGEQNTLRLRVTPRRVGDFRVRVRSSLALPANGCEAVTALPEGGVAAVDQQGHECREFTLTVREPEPAPVFRAVSRSADAVALGESFDLHLSVLNAGDPSAQAGIMVIFPDLTGAGDAALIRNYGSSTGDSPGLMIHPVGQTLLTPDCAPMPAASVVAEYWDANWTAGERNDLGLRITPRAVGTFTYLVRSVMQRPLAACDPVVGTPDDQADVVDALGYPCRAYTVTVREPRPEPVFTSHTRTADTITLGQSFELNLTLANQGDASDDGLISVGFPDLTDPARAINAGSSTGDDPGLAILPPGSIIQAADCASRTTDAVLADYRDDFWTRGERNDLRLRITPQAAGTFTYTVSGALKRPLDACGAETAVPEGGVAGVDARGRPCRTYTVTVLAP
ncbi:MAG TPA: hypothetical protein P5571_05925 [Candidatus Krumholzibacteria bacterium]|nr:hypothetical protein [Candidatus Krumholzibacteria bacterium]